MMTGYQHPSILIQCESQEKLDQIIANNQKAIVLFYNHAMPEAKVAEDMMHEYAHAFESAEITNIPFVLVNHDEFDDHGRMVPDGTKTQIRYVFYHNGREHSSTRNSTELEGLITTLL
ncbi:hypothetical protein BGX23_008875 [Mortierella sp. AD031]|nr:hypothetical protein BGX23_008875 [Mortierella sp. AD031]